MTTRTYRRSPRPSRSWSLGLLVAAGLFFAAAASIANSDSNKAPMLETNRITHQAPAPSGTSLNGQLVLADSIGSSALRGAIIGAVVGTIVVLIRKAAVKSPSATAPAESPVGPSPTTKA